MISDYTDALASRLGFDPDLAQRVRQEVEDHLREIVAADRTGDKRAAERRAVAQFGDPDAIAVEFALGSLAEQSRKVGAVLIVAIAGVLIAMKTRIASYDQAQEALSDALRALGAAVVTVDRYAFWLSALLGIVFWAYVSRRSPAGILSSFRKRLRRCFRLGAIAAGALLTSVLSDGVLTTLRLIETGAAAGIVIPLVTMAIEIACVAIVITSIRGVSRRMESTAALLR
jgi:hypothetical protein